MTRIDPVWATVAELSAAYEARTLSPVDAVGRAARAHPQARRRAPRLHRRARGRRAAGRRGRGPGHALGPPRRAAARRADRAQRPGGHEGPRDHRAARRSGSDRVSPVTATLAERLIAAGMIVLGKTHTVEFAMGSFGTNTHMGTPRNPWDPAVHRTPGGSSSGSGVAVGGGPGAGGDRHGHREARCGCPPRGAAIVGLKVTAGRISTYGVLPLIIRRSTRRGRWRARSRTPR